MKESSCRGMNLMKPQVTEKLPLNPSRSHALFVLPPRPPFISSQFYGLCKALPRLPQAFEKHKSRYMPVVTLPCIEGFLFAHIRLVLTYLSEACRVPRITRARTLNTFFTTPIVLQPFDMSKCKRCWIPPHAHALRGV